MADGSFNWREPLYLEVFNERARMLRKIRADAGLLAAMKVYYANHIADFISDWGETVDPRNVERGLSPTMPFILFPKQCEWIDFVLDCWRNQEPGLTDKSRDGGLSWLAIAFSCSMCLFNKGMVIGFGSKKEELVDKLGDPKCLFYKARQFMQGLPIDFRGGWDATKHAPHMRINFPETGSVITGEAGDQIGRGNRTSIFFVDEAAHLERPQLIDASLSATTNCRQDISSCNGPNNPFFEKRHSGKIRTFTLSWQDDPRKDRAWYDKKCAELDPIVVAQEIDINYQASIEGLVIPSAWIQAAVDAHTHLKIKPTGMRHAALDVADQGHDKNAFAIRHGNVLMHAESWRGVGSDIFDTVERAFMLCDEYKLTSFDFDCDGLGAGVRGDARKINERRRAEGLKTMQVNPFHGSGAVMDPERCMIEGRTNESFFLNFKSQSFWSLRYRFQETYRAMQGLPYDPEKIISIAKDFPERARLVTELSQPIYKLSLSGKVQIDKVPDNMASPNLADACMMAFSPKRLPMIINPLLLEASHAQARPISSFAQV